MARINTPTKGSTRTVNRAGGEAYELSPKAKLLNMTSTCLFNEPKYYGEVEKDIFETAEAVAKKDPKFLLQLAAYLRNDLYMRTISTVLLTKAANIVDCKQFVKEYAPKILKRADELNEVIAAQLELFGKPIPNSLKKGVADAFKNFDAYQFAKYNRAGKVRFKDTIVLTHPKEPSALIKKLLDDALEAPYTWETELSAKGNKSEVWEQLIDSGKLPYMATLRNLRNMLDVGISSKHMDKVIAYIKDPAMVRRSKQFPFRFFSAYRELGAGYSNASELLDALDEACMVSYENIPRMAGTTLIASDVSGSMNSSVSARSSIRHIDIGILLSSATHKYTDKAITGCFGDIWKTYAMAKKTAGIIANVNTIIKTAQEVGWSTNGWKVIRWARDNKEFIDRFLIFTDMQLWDSSGMWSSDDDNEHVIRDEFNKYRQEVNPDARIYMFNLNGYGTVNFPAGENAVVYINGWSDKVLKFIEVVEKNPHAQVDYIEQHY